MREAEGLPHVFPVCSYQLPAKDYELPPDLHSFKKHVSIARLT